VSALGEPAGPSPRTTSDRASTFRLLSLAGLAVGAVLALVAGSRAWWRAAGTGVSVAFSGTETTGGLAQALALVVLAGALLGLVLRGRGRRVLGVLLTLAGAGVVVLGVTRPRPASGTVQSRVLEVSLADQFALVGTPWPYVYGVAGLLVVAASVLMALTAPRWPSRAGRFERPGAGETAAATQPGPAAPSADDDAASLWRLLDAGVDPTAEGDDSHTLQPEDAERANSPSSRAADPEGAVADPHPSGRVDVHEPPPGVTMKPRVPARTDEPT
jgi:uncharacterized membrane protein (TIGR02234 family)